MFTQRTSTIFFILFTLLRSICGVWEGSVDNIPYMAAVKEDINIGFNLCSAAIIGTHFLLSHNPCILKLRGKVVAVVGTSDVSHPGIISDIKDIIPHERYDFVNQFYPLVIVQTMKKIIGPKSQIVKMTTQQWSGTYQNCKFAGYGFKVYDEMSVFFRNITTGILHSHTVSGFDYKPSTCGCLKLDPKLIEGAELICVSNGHSGLCVGDYGAPVVCTTGEGPVIIAVAANFQACPDYDQYKAYIEDYRQFPCGHPSQSTETYTFVYPYVKWIKNEIERIEKIAKAKVSYSSAYHLLQTQPLLLLLFIRTINYIT